MLATITHSLSSHVLPERYSHGEVARRTVIRSPFHGTALVEQKPLYLTQPLDHEDPSAGTWQQKYYVDAQHHRPGGPILLTMPSEGATLGCAGGALAKSLHALAACAEHRWFGESVPGNSSTTAALKYLTVEQNLADQATLADHLKGEHKAHSVVAVGGSYAGASAAWVRRAHPDTFDAAISQSPPVTALVGFPEYDTSNLVALSSPDMRCAQEMARVTGALEALLGAPASKARLMALFNATYDATAPLGDVDFMYGLGDSVATAVQYGNKELLCDALLPLYKQRVPSGRLSDWQYAKVFANYTSHAWGPNFFAGCFYNSTCMRDATHGAVAQPARSWYWLKCTQLGYLQSAPQQGLTTRPRALTTAKLLEQCGYIFGAEAPIITDAKVAAFNAKVGGGTIGEEAKILEVDYSDDPWKMATSVGVVQRAQWLLSEQQPFMLLTCDGCGHCGAGVPSALSESIERQMADALTEWGIA